MRIETFDKRRSGSTTNLACLLLILFSFLSSAINSQEISGRVLNEDRTPLTYVTTSLKIKDSVFRVTATDSLGYFVFHGIEPGKLYTVSFSRVGYRSADTAISGADKIIILKKAQGVLKDVTVTAKRPLIERAIDRLIFNVEGNLNTVGLNGLELLSKTPLVSVRNETPSIIGRENVQIFINGRQSNMSFEGLRVYLKALQSDEISKIEVITNPSSEYDPSGNGGIINIVTRKIRKLGLWTTVNSGLTIGKYLTGRGGVNLNYNKGSLSLYGGLSFNKGANYNIFRDDIFYSQYTWKQEYTRKEFASNILATIGFELPVSKKSTLNGSYNRLVSYPDNDERSRISIINSGNEVDSFITANTFIHKTYVTNSANLHLTQLLDSTGKKMNVDFDVYTNRFNNNSDINNVNYWGNGNEIPNSKQSLLSVNNHDASVYSLNTEFILPLPKGRWSFGAKFSWLKNQNDVALYINPDKIIDSSNTNDFKIDEQVQAVFFNYKRKLSKKVEVQVGARGEYTQQQARSDLMQYRKTQSYFSFFPTAFLKYDLDKNNVLSFSYGRRFNRPNFNSLNPFRVYRSYFSYSEGNPYLKPYYSNNFEITHTIKNQVYYTLFYSSTKDAIRTLNIIDNTNDNLQIAKPFNYLSSRSFLLSIGETLDKFKWLSSSNEFAVYHTRTKSELAATAPTLAGWGSNFRSSNSIFFDKKKTMVGGVDFTYQSGDLSGISRNKDYLFIDLAFRYRVGQLQVSLNARDIFNSKNLYWSETVNGIVRNSFMNSNSRRLFLTLNYSFGNNKVRKANPYSTSGTEQGRVN